MSYIAVSGGGSGDAKGTIIQKTTGIDFTSTGNTTLFTPGAGEVWAPHMLYLKPTTVTSINGDNQIEVGVTNPTYDDYVAFQIIGSGVTTADTIPYTMYGISGSDVAFITNSLPLVLKVTTADSGTALVCDAYFVGWQLT